MVDKTKLYTLIFWASLLSILLWVILKVVGVINTPPLIEFYPIIGAVFAAGSFFQLVLDTRRMAFDTKRILVKVQQEIHFIDKRVAVLEAHA